MLILYYKRLACNRKNDLWLNESPALNFLKDFKIMSHEWQGGIGQKKKWRRKEKCSRQQKYQETRAIGETQPVSSLTRVESELEDVEIIRQDVPSQIWHFLQSGVSY